MSFLDELNNASRTQGEVIQEQSDFAKTEANSVYNSIKKLFIMKAQQADYVSLSDGKHIEVEYEISTLHFRKDWYSIKAVESSRKKSFFSQELQFTSRVNIVINDKTYYNSFIRELNRLASNDDIKIDIMARYRRYRTAKPDYFNPYTEHTIEATAIFCTRNSISIVVKCSACY